MCDFEKSCKQMQNLTSPEEELKAGLVWAIINLWRYDGWRHVSPQKVFFFHLEHRNPIQCGRDKPTHGPCWWRTSTVNVTAEVCGCHVLWPVQLWLILKLDETLEQIIPQKLNKQKDKTLVFRIVRVTFWQSWIQSRWVVTLFVVFVAGIKVSKFRNLCRTG